MISPLFNKLSVARRAGFVESGFDRVKDAVNGGKSALVITAADISPKTLKEVKFFSSAKVTVLESKHTKEEFGEALGIYAAVFSVNDQGFAKAITENN